MHEQNKNNIKEAENIKRNQTEMLELENTITKSKNWLQGFEIRLIKEKKESAILKTGHLKLSKQRNKIFKEWEKFRKPLMTLWDTIS